MNKIIVLFPSIAKESAEKLAKACGWEAINPFKAGLRDFRNYAGVFNYGCNREIYARNVINKTKSVATCIDKVATFKAFEKAGVPTVAHTTKRQDVPKAWDTVVIRTNAKGARAEGLEYAYRWRNDVVPEGQLFTEYFEHANEYRIMVFLGKVVGVYRKKTTADGGWDFIPVKGPYTKKMADDAIKAAKALDIDFVGFDVLRNVKGEHKFLEANSACILTDEMIEAIKAYLP